MMQILPFADRRALNVYRLFERGIYRASSRPDEMRFIGGSAALGRRDRLAFSRLSSSAGFFAAAAASAGVLDRSGVAIGGVFGRVLQPLGRGCASSIVLLAISRNRSLASLSFALAARAMIWSRRFLAAAIRLLFCAFAICRMTTSRSASAIIAHSCRAMPGCVEHCRATFGGNGQYCRAVSPTWHDGRRQLRKDKTRTVVRLYCLAICDKRAPLLN